jgi:hypothetical protein
MNYNFEKMRQKEIEEQKQIEILMEFYRREKKKDQEEERKNRLDIAMPEESIDMGPIKGSIDMGTFEESKENDG